MRVSVHRDKFVGIGTYSDESEKQQEERCGEEFAESVTALLVCDEPDEKSYGIAEYDNREIVRNLDMVCLDLEVQCHSEQRCAEYRLRNPRPPALLFRFRVNVIFPAVHSQCRPVCKNDGCKHPREPRDGHHLGVVSDLDNLHVI